MAKSFTVEASVHKQIGNGYRVKVMVIDIGLYINGMMIFPPNEDHENWSVNTPARPAGRGKYARIVEFNMKLPLWQEIYDACVNAVKAEISFTKDVVLEDISDEPFSLDNIPF